MAQEPSIPVMTVMQQSIVHTNGANGTVLAIYSINAHVKSVALLKTADIPGMIGQITEQPIVTIVRAAVGESLRNTII